MSGNFVNQPQSVRLRYALFQVHLWAGIALGLYVLVISLSGSAMVYRRELDKLLAARTVIVTPRGRRLSNAELLTAARAAYPRVNIASILIRGPRVPGAAVEVWYLLGGIHIGRGRIERLFDPYTGADLGDTVGPEPAAIGLIADLHVDLLAGGLGLTLNGAGAVLLTLTCVSGAVIWWPGRSRWRRSLTLRRGVGWRRFTWDLHSVLGFWVFMLVLMWSVTGIYLAFPHPFYSLTELFSLNGRPTAASHFVSGAIDWLVRLHFARSFGPYMKALWAILGLVPAALVVTGAMMWWNRVVRRLIGVSTEPVALLAADASPCLRSAAASSAGAHHGGVSCANGLVELHVALAALPETSDGKNVVANISVPIEYRQTVREHILIWQKLQGAKRANHSEDDGGRTGQVMFSRVPEAVLPILRLKEIPFDAVNQVTQREVP